ncbi:hypothetical protein RB195_005299 [Necator americanus]|uniref:Uncharacterized protein n=1 Tax=Necator americanus TaxID=51031 RepID=A0ABR1BQM8_NECAM
MSVSGTGDPEFFAFPPPFYGSCGMPGSRTYLDDHASSLMRTGQPYLILFGYGKPIGGRGCLDIIFRKSKNLVKSSGTLFIRTQYVGEAARLLCIRIKEYPDFKMNYVHIPVSGNHKRHYYNEDDFKVKGIIPRI